MLEQKFHLMLKRAARSMSGRLTKGPSNLAHDEIALQLVIKLPEALFKKPALQATVTVPESAVSAPTINGAVVDNIREIVSQQLGVNLTIAVVESLTATPTCKVCGDELVQTKHDTWEYNCEHDPAPNGRDEHG